MASGRVRGRHVGGGMQILGDWCTLPGLPLDPTLVTSVPSDSAEAARVAPTTARATHDRLVVRHAPFVRRYLRVLGAGSDLEDLQQDVFVALLSRPFDDRGDATTRAFLRTTARNLFLRRHRGRMAQVEAADEVWDRRCADGGDGDGAGYVDALRWCLRGIGDRARRLLDATYRDGLGRDEAARAFGMTPDGVKSALRRVRRVLQDCIERRTG